MESQFELLKQRAEQGDAAAQWDLALYYCEHPDEESSPYDWIDWVRKAAEQGHPEAEVCVGNFCEEHLDEPQAVIWYKRAAKHGYPLGDYYLGLCYKEGRGGLPLDLKQAEQCFLRASSYIEAAYEYYECYRVRTRNDIENEEELVQATRLLMQSANGGYAPAQYTLGRLYESFDDHEEARTCLEAASKQGYAAAVEYQCAVYAQQCMDAGDFKTALKYLKKGIKKDVIGICTYMCGDFWEHNYGDLLPWDDNQPNRLSRIAIASHWYSCSCIRGYEPALQQVKRCFLIENQIEPTTEHIAAVGSLLKNGSLILTYEGVRTIYYDGHPDW